MKRILNLLVLASIGFAAVGCDPASKDEPTAAPAKSTVPSAKANGPAKPAP